MQQYFIDEKFEYKNFVLSKDDSFHIIKVMRKKVGDKIFIAFSNKERYICSIEDNKLDGVVVFPVEKVELSTELSVQITIAIPPLKNDKIEYLIQKSTELGVSEIVLFNSERNISKIKDSKIESKLTRWNKIAKEAAEQSKRGAIPTISYKSSINELIYNYGYYDYKIVAYEEEAKNMKNNNLKQLLTQNLENGKIVAVFGSEGGLSSKEVNYLNDNGYKSVGLGKRILRAETAPLFFLSCIAYFVELN
ncbi:16S rRNA (uracil(1498)-N(3))-methyltransferase [Gemella sp. GH3]|uniref:RsmE family RNA methyltransferase n=1 Tax=unclassified Gemella TaxID=2624949 RepID=UPI0015D01F1D|nr:MULTISPECIES: RsmE family RNA methyltransferase [unclassified Gemella]MBF0714387.1 16S rRNA (uracil(1498)-N(3))-methyltransferase [Gemella sp. GH3.1]NYS51339.1 16S rRNA (uracil(1498)-N(3))-methyltransferase [Gemella sp. GH3]